MKHYMYLWEYSRPDQKFPVSNYFSGFVAIFKSFLTYYFVVMSIIETILTQRITIVMTTSYVLYYNMKYKYESMLINRYHVSSFSAYVLMLLEMKFY